MSKEMSGVKALPMLMVAALVCVVCSVALLAWKTFVPGKSSSASSELAVALQNTSLHAAGALEGDSAAFQALAADRQRLESLLETVPAAGRDALQTVLARSQAVLQARDAVLTVHTASTVMNEELPRLLQGVGDANAAAGVEVEQKLKAVAGSYAAVAERQRAAKAALPAVAAAQAAGRELQAATHLAAHTAASGGAGPAGLLSWLPLVMLLLALVAIAAMVAIYGSTANIRKTAEKQRVQNERNQSAILRLLDELSNLADGDLTVQATVSEDITGAIADSINYAIEALRELVTTINSSAITLDTSAKQALASVGHLAKASVAQSKQVAAASESVVAMASTVEEVSGNAERSADVARHSVDIAHKGSDAVRRTIDGMNAIRETIQETSKRIKRLGESSQEIGNIVELINDIAEQTNILALNASIQASMAGEAGRGFAVVADEVQRLAERAANATKQIEVLVRTIQADTNEAVVSMERSTTDVVGGALLAENAGAALEEIEQVSNQIASLVQNISGSARQQSTTAQNIARNMQVLREISAQTAENSSATSTSVGKLAQLSGQLRKSVAGFRLPGQADPTAAGANAPLTTKKPATQADQPVVPNVSAAAG